MLMCVPETFLFFKKIQNMLTIINFLPGNAGIMYRYTGHVGVPAINFTLCREQCVQCQKYSKFAWFKA